VAVGWRGDECLDQPRDTAVPGGGAGRTGGCLGPSDSGLGRAGLDRSRPPVVRGLRTARARGVPLRLRRRTRPLPGTAALDAAHPLSGRGLRRLGGLERLLRLVPGTLDPARTPNHPGRRRPRRPASRQSADQPSDQPGGRGLARLARRGSGLCPATLAVAGFATCDPRPGLGGPGIPALAPLERAAWPSEGPS
jgi:hypothetical protein